MATKTFYLLNTAGTTPDWNGSLQEGGSAPAAANSAFGWTVAKNAASYMQGRIGATAVVTTTSATSYISGASAPLAGTGNGITTAGDTFGSPTPYTGTFAAGNWSFTFGMRCTTSSSQAGHINFRVWAGTNPTGAGARSLAASQLCSTVSLATTTTTYNSTATWAAPAITLNNEYLFIEVEWQITTAGGANQCNVLFYQSAGTFTTTDFQPNTNVPIAATDPIDTSAIAGRIDPIGTLAVTDTRDTSSMTGTVTTPTVSTTCTWSPTDLAGITLSNGNLTAVAA